MFSYANRYRNLTQSTLEDPQAIARSSMCTGRSNHLHNETRSSFDSLPKRITADVDS